MAELSGAAGPDRVGCGAAGDAAADRRAAGDDAGPDRRAAGDYDAGAGAWADGPERLYRRLADALVAACAPLDGARLLDVGAGTGAVSRAAQDAGAAVIATDVAPGMLAHGRRSRPPAAAGDARWLPFRSAAFDVAVLGFVINHLTAPGRAVAEAARVTRPGGLVAASTFHRDWDHPAKRAVDGAAAGFGYRPPAWYRELKERAAPLSGCAGSLADVARAVGLVEVRVQERVVDSGLATPHEVVAWRLGMAHLAPFAAALAPGARCELTAAAVAAVGPDPEPVRPRVLLLTARRPPR